MKSNTKGTRPIKMNALYFKCSEGHYTPCKTKKMRVIYCKPCNKIFLKKDCERYSEVPLPGKVYKNTSRVKLGNKLLYKFTNSVRINYRRKKRENEKEQQAPEQIAVIR